MFAVVKVEQAANAVAGGDVEEIFVLLVNRRTDRLARMVGMVLALVVMVVASRSLICVLVQW